MYKFYRLLAATAATLKFQTQYSPRSVTDILSQCCRPNKVTDNDSKLTDHKSYCSTVHFRRITSIYQPTNTHIISHKTLLKHSDMFRSCQIIIRDHFFLAKVILRYSQFNSYLQTRCCGSISCCVGMCCGAVARCASCAETCRHPNKTDRKTVVF